MALSTPEQTNLSVHGVALEGSQIKMVPTKSSAPSKGSRRTTWSELYPTMYSSNFTKLSRSATNMRAFSISPHMISRSVTSMNGFKPATSLSERKQILHNCDSRSPRPNATFSNKEVSLISHGVGISFNKYKRHQRLLQADKSKDCSVCQCHHYAQRSTAKAPTNLGRHQKCICECYCHLAASELGLMHVAAKLGHTKLVEHLIEKGEQADQLDVHNNTSLHLAAMHGHTATLALLLEKGVQPDTKNVNGNGALHLAAKYGHLCCALNLQKYGTDINLVNHFQVAPIHIAVKEKRYAIVQNFLKNPNLDVNLPDGDGNTALHLAIQFFDINIVSMLLKHAGVNVNSQNNLGQTPLHVAAQHNRSSILTQILQLSQVDANLCDELGNTILHIAVMSGSRCFVQELISLKRNFDSSQEELPFKSDKADAGGNPHLPDLDATNNLGRTALHLAILNNSIAIVTDLIDGGSNVSSVDLKGNGYLHHAAAVGNIVISEFLIGRGLDMDAVNNSGDTSLHIAIHCGHIKLVKLLLSLDANPNKINLLHESPLHRAVKKGLASLIILLLRYKADPTIKDIDGKTPIHLAVESGNETVAMKMLSWLKEYDLMTLDIVGNSLLHVACKKGLSKVAAYILERVPRLLAVSNVYGNIPIHYSCKYRHFELTKQMLQASRTTGHITDVRRITNIAGKTALHMSAKSCDTLSTKYLLGEQFDTSVHDEKGRTPLHIACSSRNEQQSVKVVELLLRYGAQVNPVDLQGETPLHYAAKAGNNAVIAMLIAHGADVNTTNLHQHTPLHLASAYGKDKAMETLIKKGADFMMTTSDGNSALHGSAASGNVSGLSFLIKLGASPNIKNQDGTTAAHVAAANDQHGVIDYLIEAGADLTETDNKGRTALHIAVAKGNIKAVKALLRSGVPVDLKDNFGHTSWHYACATSQREICSILREHIGSAEASTLDVLSTSDLGSHVVLEDSDDATDILLTNQLKRTVPVVEKLGSVHEKRSSQNSMPLDETDEIEEETRSTCTEDDIADQLGIFTQQRSLEAAIVKEDHERDMNEMALPEEIVSRDVQMEDAMESEALINQLPSLPSSANRERQRPPIIEPDSSLTLPSLTQMVTVQPPPKPAVCLPEVRNVETPSYAKADSSKVIMAQAARKAKAVNNRRGRQMLLPQVGTEEAANERNRRRWLLEDDDPFTFQEGKQSQGRSESDMSFRVEPRTPSPTSSEVEEEKGLTAEQLTEKAVAEEAAEQRRKWGKAKVDNRFREEQERQRLAEERKRKAMKMKLARSQHLNFQKFPTDSELDDGDFSDFNWLAQYCIFGRGALGIYQDVFNTLLNSSGETKINCERLSMEETLMALTSINRELKAVEQEYVIRICETLGHSIRGGCDFKLFSLLAALSHRIASLDDFMRRIYSLIDLRAVDINLHFCRQLWEACRDADTNTMSKDKLTVELRAGGISPIHEGYVKQALSDKQELDFLDFLTYIPLFIFIHRSVIGNPLDDSRTR